MKKILLVIIALLTLIYSCSEPSNRFIENNINKKETPDQICHNMEFVFFDSSITKNVINAKRARIYSSKKETILDSGVFVRFYNSIGKQNGTLKANEINIDDATKDMTAKGNVIVISDSSNTKLETTKLNWKQDTRKIYTDVYVKITSPTEIIEGIGLESDENLSNYKIYKVTGIKQ